MRVVDQGVAYDTTCAPTNQRSASSVSLLMGSDGTVYVTARLGTEREGPDGHTAILASTDAGRSWELRFLGLDERKWDGVTGETRGWYLAEADPQTLVASVLWVDRSDPELPWVNPRTQGLLPMHIYHLRSSDGARTWPDRRKIDTARRPGMSPTGAIRPLSVGVLAQPLECWKDYDDPEPGHPAALLLLSLDDGVSWTEELVVAADPDNQLFYWDQRLATHPNDGRSVAMFWTHEPAVGRDRDVHIAWSSADGRRWSIPVPTGLPGQHCQPVAVGGERLLAVYAERTPNPGIRVARSPDFGRSWDLDDVLDVYSSAAGVEPGSDRPRDQADYWNDMGAWQFGHPSGVVMPDGHVLVAFYAGTGQTRSLRWARLEV